MRFQRRLHRGAGHKTTSDFAFVLVSGSARFHMTPQGQQAESVRALKEVLVGKAAWLGHHDDAILQRSDAEKDVPARPM